ncbi:uncharacterized protein MELLADRAFT_68861 [Melampsora larici-populina 98AG31]|uniref:Uncharacterized protein n=1 Tax=Melampsora larici-populina (strain 98AG31 / pathotype 3-4-7) TaxID=747676 RepID=F4S8F9_MELLP|nr:uncharacterized protein MELLADRAFT_68861 [Melampsora larici-populina 98AG31]EGF99095.1 hypothetical protein MELLADRAFT_68861 [Melampsora larici-populina 98AG31]
MNAEEEQDEDEEYDPKRTIKIKEARAEYLLARLEHLNSLVEGDQTEFKIVEAWKFNEIPRAYRAAEIVLVRQFKPKCKANANGEDELSLKQWLRDAPSPKRARVEPASGSSQEPNISGTRSKSGADPSGYLLLRAKESNCEALANISVPKKRGGESKLRMILRILI